MFLTHKFLLISDLINLYFSCIAFCSFELFFYYGLAILRFCPTKKLRCFICNKIICYKNVATIVIELFSEF